MNGVGGGVWIANDTELSDLPRSVAAFLKSMNENKKRKKNIMYLRIVYLINASIIHICIYPRVLISSCSILALK